MGARSLTGLHGHIYIYMYIFIIPPSGIQLTIQRPFHHITLHYITSHYITSHYIALQLKWCGWSSNYTTFHYITLSYIILHDITIHYITQHHSTLHTMTLHHIRLHYFTSHYITLHYIRSDCSCAWCAPTALVVCVIASTLSCGVAGVPPPWWCVCSPPPLSWSVW